MIKRRSKKQNFEAGGGFVAKRKGDAVVVNVYGGRSKVKNFAYFLDATTWPAERIDQTNMAYFLLHNPTLLKGPSLRNPEMHEAYAPFWRFADAFVAAVNEILQEAE